MNKYSQSLGACSSSREAGTEKQSSHFMNSLMMKLSTIASEWINILLGYRRPLFFPPSMNEKPAADCFLTRPGRDETSGSAWCSPSVSCRGNRDKPRFLLTTVPLRSTSIIITKVFPLTRGLQTFGDDWPPPSFLSCNCRGGQTEAPQEWMGAHQADKEALNTTYCNISLFRTSFQRSNLFLQKARVCFLLSVCFKGFKVAHIQ